MVDSVLKLIIYRRHEPTFFCSSLIKSETAWLWLEKLKLQAKEVLLGSL